MSPVATAEPRQLRMPIRAQRALKRKGRDTLPENTRYRDGGCSISESCFTCPLPRCRYEEPGGLRAVLNEHRDRQILSLRGEGVPVEELAVRFRVSRRTIFRVLEGTSVRSRHRRPGKTPIPIFLRRETGQKEANCA